MPNGWNGVEHSRSPASQSAPISSFGLGLLTLYADNDTVMEDCYHTATPYQ